MTTLTLVDLSKAYAPHVSAVSHLNLTVEQGELMVLLGPSGCGKSTTLRLIAGLLAPSSGDILFDGRSVRGVAPEKRGAVMVFQENALFPFMNVGENVAYGLRLRKRPTAEIRQRVASALAAVQLSGYEDRWPEQLSGGQKGRIALARALVINPRLLLLDEPLSGLDRGLREEMRVMIAELQKRSGITTLFVTHDQEEAVVLADRIGVMMDGSLRQIGAPEDFYRNPADARVAHFFGARNFLPGTIDNRRVKTEIGDLEIERMPMQNGASVLLCIRPEVIALGVNAQNSFPATVETSSGSIPGHPCQILINNVRLHLSLPPNCELYSGEHIFVHFPRNSIIVFPAV